MLICADDNMALQLNDSYCERPLALWDLLASKELSRRAAEETVGRSILIPQDDVTICNSHEVKTFKSR